MAHDGTSRDDKLNLNSLATEPPAQSATPGKAAGHSQRAPTIELLYFLGCPNYQRALVLLQEAVAMAKVDASVDLVAVETQEEADRQQFYGSPTIRINGVDIVAPDPSASPALACRVYRTATGKLSPIPPVEAINAALHRS
jgi:hypothetical protein